MDGIVRTFGTALSIAVPKVGDDTYQFRFQYRRMVKPKHRPVARPGWYVAEWLIYLNMQQTDLIEATGRSKGRVSELVSGRQRFNEDDLAAFSRVLGVSRGYLLEVNPLVVGPEMANMGKLPPPPVPASASAKRRA